MKNICHNMNKNFLISKYKDKEYRLVVVCVDTIRCWNAALPVISSRAQITFEVPSWATS